MKNSVFFPAGLVAFTAELTHSSLRLPKLTTKHKGVSRNLALYFNKKKLQALPPFS